MILNDKTIKEYSLEKGLIEPFDEKNIDTCSYDLHLGNTAITDNRDLKIDINLHTQDSKCLTIKPHQFVLATTKEKLNLPNNIVGRVEGISSVGRTGLFIQNASLVKPGFNGTITLELFDASDHSIRLYEDDRIAQITFELTTGDCEGYKGRYQNQNGATRAIEDE